MKSHPDIVVEKKSDSPDEDKRVHDSKLLIPVSSMETKNGTILTKYELLLKEISVIRKRIPVSLAGVHEMKKHYMQT